MAFGYPVEFNDNGLIGGRQAFDMVHGDSERTYVPAIITGPDEFKYKILSARSGVAERFVAVALRSSNLAATEAYWVNTLGMKKLPPPRGLDRKAEAHDAQSVRGGGGTADATSHRRMVSQPGQPPLCPASRRSRSLTRERRRAHRLCDA